MLGITLVVAKILCPLVVYRVISQLHSKFIQKSNTERDLKATTRIIRRCYERLPPPWGVRVPEKQRALALPNGI